MGGGNKKNKRGSIPSSLSSSSPVSHKTELIERTPENDYGVLSDPDENSPTTDDTLHAVEPALNDTSIQDAVHVMLQNPTEDAHPQSLEDSPPIPLSTPECSHTQNEQPPSSHSPSHSPLHSCQDSPLHSQLSLSPLSQDQDPSLQQSISQTLTSNNKSLETLKLKLLKDKNFSRKITLHTFFSYIILAMEIQRSCSASIAQLSVNKVKELITYMIENHSASNPVRIYLHTLNDTGVVNNIIESIIEFNKDNKNSPLETLYTSEENEMEISFILNSVIDNVSINTAKVNVSNEQPENNTPQTSPKCGGFFKRLRSFFSRCCG
jgi:hypothetical protein